MTELLGSLGEMAVDEGEAAMWKQRALESEAAVLRLQKRGREAAGGWAGTWDVACAGADGAVRLYGDAAGHWSSCDAAAAARTTACGSPAICLAWEPTHGERLAAGCMDGSLRLLDVPLGHCDVAGGGVKDHEARGLPELEPRRPVPRDVRARQERPPTSTRRVGWLGDGAASLVSNSADPALFQWDFASGKLLTKIDRAHEQGIRNLDAAVSGDKRDVAFDK
ncbi:hypothetical protein JL722_12465 [Aureococcus anophagefferens]|nr:hypothetical protein JL722_12465 [Aureococcus anophagefferens]